MSSKDMFRKEQRFSFRKFSFGLASAVIANVIFGGAIANTPVVHANTTTETAAVATSERIASIPYTVNIVDQAGKVVETKEKKVLVYTVETIATATDYLTADLVPEGYAIVSGLGEVTLTEKAENVFTVKVDKIAPEAVATTTTAESATSETSTAATPEPASLTATQSTPVTAEVAEAEVAPTTSEESAKPTERTVYLSYITHYVNEANETVDRTGHLVAVTTTDETAKTQVTVSASENMPSGWELVQDKAKVVVQLVENQTNILVFAVTKKSKEEEIAESQLSNRDVLMRLSLEADLLADEALRQVAKEQAGNTALETAANETKAVAATANEVLANTAATEAELDDQIDTVRTSTQNLAAEMLKVDKDGILTAMLDATTQAITITTSSTGAVRPDYENHIRAYATSAGQRVYNNQDFFFGLIGKDLTEQDSQIRATAEAPDGSALPVSLVGGGWQEIPESDKYGLNINNSGVIYGKTTITQAGNTVSWRFKASSSGYDTVGSQFTFVPYTVVKTDEEPVRKAVTAGVTADEILAKVKSDVTRGNGTSSTNEATAGPLNIAFEQHFNSALTARATGKSTKVAEDAKNGKQIWHEIVGAIPTTAGRHTVTVRSTNVHGQTIDTDVVVDLYDFEAKDRAEVRKYTDWDKPIHAIMQIGQTGEEAAVVLENIPDDFQIENFNITDEAATKLAERNLEFVKNAQVVDKEDTVDNKKDGIVGYIRPKAEYGNVATYTGSSNIAYTFKYTRLNNATADEENDVLSYTILFIDTQKPVVTPKSEYIRFVDEAYTISVPGTDNAYLDTGKINGSLSVLKDGETGKVSPGLGTSTNIASELDSTGKGNQGDNSTKFNVNITGTAPSAEGTGTYNLRVGENNYPAGPEAERVDGKKPENVGLTPIKVTFVKRAEVTTPVAVVDPANLTTEEKAAVIKQLKEDNADNQRLQDLPESAFTVNADGTVSVDYSAGGTNIDAVTDTVQNATVKLADAQKEAKDAIDAKLAEEKAAIEAKRDADIAEINNTPGLTDDQKKAARDAVTDTAGDALKALDKSADDAKKAIDAETTVAGINNAKTDGEKALDDATVNGEAAIDLTKDKELAKADVDNQAKAAIEAVKNNPNLDATEQAPYIKAIEDAAKEQKAAIDAAKDTAGITDAVNEAEKVNEEQKLAAAKEDAKDKIAEEAAAAKDAIDDNPNLSDAEKQAAKDAVDAEVAKA
ncbi:YSIRK-type signal peptide-containing protein, partial [Streptococcus suis]